MEDTVSPDAQTAAADAGASAGDSLDAALDEGDNEGEGEGDAEAAEGEAEEEPEESAVAEPEGSTQYRYTAELSDEELEALWKTAPEKLGSISLGFVAEGRMINSVKFPEGDGWIVVSPEKTYGTQETVDAVLTVIHKVRGLYPDAPPLRVNQISTKDGGYIRPHKSHQSGRDVDLGFFYPTADPIRVRAREKYIDVPKTWALLKAVITLTDVKFVLVDRRVQKVLYDYALENGEDQAWLDSIFRSSKPLVMHARGHRDHFHVRFYNPRAQELGRRVAPLLAQRPDQNLVMHRVRKGETLSHLAVRYNTTVAGIRKANRMRGSFLRISQVLKIPLRGPCTRCPIPPPLELPPRRLPPGFTPDTDSPAVVTAQVAPADSVDSDSTEATPAVMTAEPASTGAGSSTTAQVVRNAAAPSGGSSSGGATDAPASSSPAAR